MQVEETRILGVNRDRGIPQHGLGAGGGDHDLFAGPLAR